MLPHRYRKMVRFIGQTGSLTSTTSTKKGNHNNERSITTPQTERITLYYREGSSDKVYQASIEPQGEGFVVNFAYGRRGATLNTGTKTQTPVDHDSAKSIYDKLVREKKAKGYTEGPDGTPYQHTAKEDRVTGLLPQLLNPIDEHQVNRLIQRSGPLCAREIRRPQNPGSQSRR